MSHWAAVMLAFLLAAPAARAAEVTRSNTEMKAIYDADQKVRTPPFPDPNTIIQGDMARRARVRQLLAAGALHSGKDFEEAAFVFQHGDKADDFLLAHTLAMIAMARGDQDAIWISAATLDRYLINIDQKQIYGTQYYRRRTPNKYAPVGEWTQEPYDRTLISDALRTALTVPDQAAQKKELERMRATP